ncbi:Lsr2 family protein [Leucobacter sp. cx-169]|uniref:histone-like nucleoid-structuring protein Lsr2 n=1 Tax=Leucobacter sp. cx-169 TaxID=2770549 RepID=UPI00165E63A0|nr:Lsr2 family protein [Leucobacter sp. cx-169]MBC9927222.1 Lsr2 family protein [Leucobacter sp. cx-169]
MATKQTVQFIDDVDGSTIDGGTDPAVQFGLDGRAYEIDLTDENAAALRSTFAPYIAAGRKAQSRTSASAAPAAAKDPDRVVLLAEARVWARENGHTVSDRGRIAAPIMDAFLAQR